MVVWKCSEICSLSPLIYSVPTSLMVLPDCRFIKNAKKEKTTAHSTRMAIRLIVKKRFVLFFIAS